MVILYIAIQAVLHHETREECTVHMQFATVSKEVS